MGPKLIQLGGILFKEKNLKNVLLGQVFKNTRSCDLVPQDLTGLARNPYKGALTLRLWKLPGKPITAVVSVFPS